MASDHGDSKPLESKTWVLKVSIHCEGCKKKVRKILQRVGGVDTIEINSQKNQVIVTGNVEAETLIAKLVKSGKHSQLWPTENKPQNPKPKINYDSAYQEKDKNKVTTENTSKSREPENASVKKPEGSETSTKPKTSKTETEQAQNEVIQVKNDGKQVEKEAQATENSTKEVENKTEADTKQSDTGKKKKKKKEKVIEEKEEVPEEKDRSVNAAPMMHSQPMYHQPTYVASYNIAQPAQSYSHFAPMPQTPQNYASSNNAPQENHAYSYQNYPSYPSYQNYPPQESYVNYPRYSNYPMYSNYPDYTNESQHDSMGYEASSSSQAPEGYDYFSEENPNSCSLM